MSQFPNEAPEPQDKLPLSEESPFYDPASEVQHLSGQLPHWRQSGKLYFVTFRLADSLPAEKRQQLQEELAEWKVRNPPPHSKEQIRDFYQRFTDRPQAWLDAGYGSCILRLPEVASLVGNSISHFAGIRYILGSYVVAANHAHVIVQPINGFGLSQILHSWKSFTAHEILKIDIAREQLKASWKQLFPGGDEPLRVWQKESFDHIIRNPESMEHFSQYIDNHKK